MRYRFETRGPRATAVVVLTGRLDLRTATELRGRLQRLILEGWNQLVVDLGGVPFVDSSGLGALIGGLEAARGAGGDCRIARPAEPIRRLLRASTLDRVLMPYDTVEDALAEYV